MVIKPANFGKYALIFVSPFLEEDFPVSWPNAFHDFLKLISDASIVQDES